MISCRFIISHNFLSDLDVFIEDILISNVSLFENTELGFSEELDENGFPVAKFFNAEIFVNNEKESEELKNVMHSKFGVNIKNFISAYLKEEDWVDLYTKELKPVLCEKFYFYNDEIQNKPLDETLIPIKLNSALAFGSGHHQTTQGCLLNLLFLEGIKFQPKNVLDMGCGTGILGICSSKIWNVSNVIGIDIDPEAVRITKENYKANAIVANAITNSNVDSLNGKEFDLIICNILKQPLIDLCKDFSRILKNDCYIITSGYIKNQENEVIDFYEINGFEITNRIVIEDWISILFRKI